MELLEGERVLAFDLETTGISTSRDRIVQLALIGSDSNGTEISYDQLVNPRRPIPYESQRIHGISDSEVRGEPDFAQIADRVSELIDGCVLIGHNVRIGDEEKDGCVVNTYLNIEGSIYPKLGWHTDGLRDNPSL